MPYVHAGYAYPTSPIAEKTGHGKTGCWYIAVTKDKLTPVDTRHIKDTFPTDADAPSYVYAEAISRVAEEVRNLITKRHATPGFIAQSIRENAYLRGLLK